MSMRPTPRPCRRPGFGNRNSWITGCVRDAPHTKLAKGPLKVLGLDGNLEQRVKLNFSKGLVQL